MKKNLVKIEVGLWIDHKRAVVITLMEGATVTKEIQSDFDRRPRRAADGNESDTHERIISETKHENQNHNLLHKYYEAIVRELSGASKIYIFGPGEAKHELKSMLESRLDTRTIPTAMEAADSLTDPQIAAKTKAHFHPEIKRAVNRQ